MYFYVAYHRNSVHTLKWIKHYFLYMAYPNTWLSTHCTQQQSFIFINYNMQMFIFLKCTYKIPICQTFPCYNLSIISMYANNQSFKTKWRYEKILILLKIRIICFLTWLLAHLAKETNFNLEKKFGRTNWSFEFFPSKNIEIHMPGESVEIARNQLQHQPITVVLSMY